MIVSVILFFFIIYITIRIQKEENNLLFSFVYFIICCLASFIIIAVTSIILLQTPITKTKKIVNTQKIYCINDTTITNTVFVTASNENDVYKMYIDGKYPGSKKLLTVNISNSSIYEDNSNPRIETYYEDIDNKILDFIFPFFNIKERYDIYVPKNTISNEYSIDLNK